MEAITRASLIDEEARQMRDHKVAARASGSRIADVERRTTEGAVISADTTGGVPTT